METIKRHRDFILVLLGSIIAIVSLCFSIWQGRQTIKHNHISVEPRISSYFANDGRQSKWGIYLINNGLGPSFILNTTVFVEDKEVEPIRDSKFLGGVGGNET